MMAWRSAGTTDGRRLHRALDSGVHSLPVRRCPPQGAAPDTPAPAWPQVPAVADTPQRLRVTHVHVAIRPAKQAANWSTTSMCEDTAAERRAPYGDSYDINRLSRPFQQDMTYVPDLDIVTYTVSSDSTWWFVSDGTGRRQSQQRSWASTTVWSWTRITTASATT